jgi:hypothetical protein
MSAKGIEQTKIGECAARQKNQARQHVRCAKDWHWVVFALGLVEGRSSQLSVKLPVKDHPSNEK